MMDGSRPIFNIKIFILYYIIKYINLMVKKDSVFIKLLKENTNIDEDFIDTFFKKFKIGGELDFDIIDTDVSKYL